MRERGATEQEVLETIGSGERFAAKRGRIGFRQCFFTPTRRRARWYEGKEIVAYTETLSDGWLVITVIVKYLDRKEPPQ